MKYNVYSIKNTKNPLIKKLISLSPQRKIKNPTRQTPKHKKSYFIIPNVFKQAHKSPKKIKFINISNNEALQGDLKKY